MLVHLFFTMCVLGFAAINYRRGGRNVLYPPFLFALVMLVVLCIYIAPPIEVERLEWYTLFVVVCGVAAFSAGGATVRRRRYARPAAQSPPVNSISRKIIFLCCLAILPAFYLEIRRLSGVGGLDGLLISARAAAIEAVINGEKSYSNPVFGSAPILAMFSALIFLIETHEGRKGRAWVWCSILTALAFSILT